jgi:hypothetical protein
VWSQSQILDRGMPPRWRLLIPNWWDGGGVLWASCSAHRMKQRLFAEFLLLAGLSKIVGKEILFTVSEIKVLAETMPGVEQQSRRKEMNRKSESFHYLYLGRDVVDSQTIIKRRQPKPQPKRMASPKRRLLIN